MPKIVDQSPSPKSHIKTLMRIGYTLNSAVADVIDNSLSAEAQNIVVYAPPGEAEPFISIADDGNGMTADELTENMRIGCKDPDVERQEGDLGRFGSGMKTASFSQARKLTVVTKKTGHALTAASWDIDRVEETNSWCLEVYDENEVLNISGLSEDLLEGSGTQIIWSKLTFLEKGSHVENHDSELASRLAELDSYLALHFHRFMVGANRRTFRLNNAVIKPIDPFMIGESGYQEGPSEKLRCKGGHIFIRTHVLPHFKKMNPLKLKALGGAEGVAEKQGLYIYREKRLINAGGWLGMSRNSQLGALARIQVDIPAALDNDWSTDVKKASLQMPPRVKKQLRKFLADPVKRSKRIYNYKGQEESANGFWKILEDETTKKITYQIDADNDSLIELARKCSADERRILRDYLKQLSMNLPINHIYKKMSERPRDVSQDEVDMAILENILGKVFDSEI